MNDHVSSAVHCPMRLRHFRRDRRATWPRSSTPFDLCQVARLTQEFIDLGSACGSAQYERDFRDSPGSNRTAIRRLAIGSSTGPLVATENVRPDQVPVAEREFGRGR